MIEFFAGFLTMTKEELTNQRYDRFRRM